MPPIVPHCLSFSFSTSNKPQTLFAGTALSETTPLPGYVRTIYCKSDEQSSVGDILMIPPSNRYYSYFSKRLPCEIRALIYKIKDTELFHVRQDASRQFYRSPLATPAECNIGVIAHLTFNRVARITGKADCTVAANFPRRFRRNSTISVVSLQSQVAYVKIKSEEKWNRQEKTRGQSIAKIALLSSSCQSPSLIRSVRLARRRITATVIFAKFANSPFNLYRDSMFIPRTVPRRCNAPKMTISLSADQADSGKARNPKNERGILMGNPCKHYWVSPRAPF